ncbi:hypothetical protein KB206_20670 [Microvirga sp. STS02]|uniref:hypothetical protein n=1 Tax=Hymenobacter negativus TaxID=2795026 RepID=UPI0018DCAB36|nr:MULTISPECIES: hypothetical protein [Bacteria]MBH8571318.1 hypothetical protein [Hymenobacter negativus]MBR7211056.1 hypothetical protein [Microvirga sp. STS02]
MKHFSAILVVFLLALASQPALAQTIRRVNNSGITGTNIYTTLQAAHDAASNGDIIQLEPSGVSAGTLTCTKNVRILGPGYFLVQNQPPALQASTFSATTGTIIFNSGSSGAALSGLTVSGDVQINTSNIAVQRNNITGYVYIAYTNNALSNAVIRQNYINAGIAYNTSPVVSNILVTNNIVIGLANLSPAGFSGEFSNNVVLGTVSLNNFTVQNNYIGSTLTVTNNTSWTNNLLAQATLPTAGFSSNNTAGVAQSTVFVLAPGSTAFDAWYKLKTGTNPATGGGTGGTDIGAFGGSSGYGYRLSGIPSIPSIYQLDQQVNGNALNITISTRSNN